MSSSSGSDPNRMRIGVGLPTTVPGCSGDLLFDWARRADAGPFSSVGVLDRIAYQSYEPLLALSAAAGVTSSVRLVTMVVAAPLRNTAELAKQAASLNVLSGDRLTLGVALGARQEDYELVGADYATRGRRFSTQLQELRAHWDSEKSVNGSANGNGSRSGPKQDPESLVNSARVNSAPKVLIGGNADLAFSRVARYGDGYVHGGGPPRAFANAAAKANAAWIDADRSKRPQLWGQAYFALGDPARGERYMRDYYAFTGPFVEKIAAGLLTTPQSIVSLIRGYEDAGCDELVLFPAVAELEELDRLMDVLARLV